MTPKKNKVIPPLNRGTNTESSQTEITTTTTTTNAAAPSHMGIPKTVVESLPEIYRGHQDVLKTLSTFRDSHGADYVEMELTYTIENSTKAGGFPSFLKRSLANGWGVDAMQLKKTLAEKHRLENDRQLQRRIEEERKQKEDQALVAERQRELDEKVQATISTLSPGEFEIIKDRARKEAESRIPRPKGYAGELASLAKRKLSNLPEQERDRIRKEAEASIQDSLGDALSANHPGRVRAVENRMVRIVQDTYSLISPLTQSHEKRVLEKTEALIRKQIISEFDLFREVDACRALMIRSRSISAVMEKNDCYNACPSREMDVIAQNIPETHR